MSNTSRARIAYLDYLRVISTAAVILLHVAAQNWYITDIHGFAWNVLNIYDSIVRWAVPVFIMISGALFLGSKSTFSTIKKHVPRLIIAYFVWSLFYALESKIFQESSWLHFFADVIRGHYHLWFIPMILGLYLCIPIIQQIVSNKSVAKYFLFLSFLFAFALPQCFSIIESTPSSEPFLLIQKGMELIEKAIPPMNLVMGYTGYFILGHFLHHTNLTRKCRILIYGFGLVGFIATILLSAVFSRWNQTPIGTFYGYFNVNVLLESMAVFVFVKQLLGSQRCTPHILMQLSQYSFGAYLVHDFIINWFQKIGFDTLTGNPALMVPLLTACVFVVSFSISALINCIPILKKYIV